MGNRLWMVLEQEVEDHYLVTETLKGLDGGLHCYRSVGGVLMESTVSDVQPAVRKELEMLSNAVLPFIKKAPVPNGATFLTEAGPSK